MTNFNKINSGLHTKVKQKAGRWAREARQTLAYILFGSVPSAIKRQRGLKVLVYHGICPKEPFKFNSRFLSEQQFEAHLIAFKKYYHAVSLKEFQAGRLSADKFNILLTFDDGLKNNFKYALPLLIKHNIPAVFFITGPEKKEFPYLLNDLLDVFSFIGPANVNVNNTGFVKKKIGRHYRYCDKEGRLLAEHCRAMMPHERERVAKQVFEYSPVSGFRPYHDYLERMTEKEISALSKVDRMAVGNHGYTHADFSVLDPAELEAELRTSKSWLERITAKPCNILAFPYGSYNPHTLHACQEIGRTVLFGMDRVETGEDHLQVIERLTVNPYVSAINQLYYIAKGGYE